MAGIPMSISTPEASVEEQAIHYFSALSSFRRRETTCMAFCSCSDETVRSVLTTGSASGKTQRHLVHIFLIPILGWEPFKKSPFPLCRMWKCYNPPHWPYCWKHRWYLRWSIPGMKVTGIYVRQELCDRIRLRDEEKLICHVAKYFIYMYVITFPEISKLP